MTKKAIYLNYPTGIGFKFRFVRMLESLNNDKQNRITRDHNERITH